MEIWEPAVTLVQGLLSILLVAEEPTFLRALRPVRALSFLGALLFDTNYLWALYKFLGSNVKLIADGKFYDLIVNYHDSFAGSLTPLMIINTAIVHKELYFVSLSRHLQDWDGNDAGRIGLTTDELFSAIKNVFNLLNPFWWINRLFNRTQNVKQDLRDYHHDHADVHYY